MPFQDKSLFREKLGHGEQVHRVILPGILQYPCQSHCAQRRTLESDRKKNNNDNVNANSDSSSAMKTIGKTSQHDDAWQGRKSAAPAVQWKKRHASKPYTYVCVYIRIYIYTMCVCVYHACTCLYIYIFTDYCRVLNSDCWQIQRFGQKKTNLSSKSQYTVGAGLDFHQGTFRKKETTSASCRTISFQESGHASFT